MSQPCRGNDDDSYNDRAVAERRDGDDHDSDNELIPVIASVAVTILNSYLSHVLGVMAGAARRAARVTTTNVKEHNDE